ncbi:hypothetical protein K466DRAFT_415087 [Polyporus arcularius HHB13444]|uniref:Uncharacterized protein n=1 Tax=Polyporus arcularius HHB13444 TaxID=1314778 RepID=A0A5C3PNP3_9APHY|nr:hypothetical protein K466DRAFT_415087 [Polyporus arcularius HHB13444]
MSSGDPAIVYPTSMSVAEPPRRLPMESNYPRTKEWSDAAVAASQNNRTPAPRTSLGYKTAWERTSGDPSPPSQSSRDFTLGYMEKLPQHNAGAPRDAALQRRGAHAPHAWKSESDIPEIHRQDQERIPLFSHGHRRTNGSIGNGVHVGGTVSTPPLTDQCRAAECGLRETSSTSLTNDDVHPQWRISGSFRSGSCSARTSGHPINPAAAAAASARNDRTSKCAP